MAAPVLWGSEFLVNTFTQDDQSISDVVLLKDGSFVAVWGLGLADDRGGIRGQVFYADGTKKGGEFIITDHAGADGDTGRPSIAVLNDGRFVVAWQDFSRQPGDDQTEIRARLYSPAGEALGTEFLVNSNKDGMQRWPDVSATANGGFVITYETPPVPGGVAAQAYDANGNPLGVETPVPMTAGSNPIVVGLNNGNYAVFYSGSIAADPSSIAIIGRIMTADGQPAPGSQEFLVPTTTTGDQQNPAATLLEDGRIVVVWQHPDGPTGDGSGSCIMGQILNADGSKLGGEFRVNVTTENGQMRPAVTALAGGGFAVAFEDTSRYDEAKSDICLVTFDRFGTRASDEIRVNAGLGEQTDVSLTALADGRILVSWSDETPGRPDDPLGIRAQIVDPRTKAISHAGTSFNDQYIGTGFGDTLGGAAGSDHLRGEGGDDVLDGGAGADILSGGDGIDLVSFASARSGVTASLAGGSGGDAAGDTYSSIEGLLGSSFDDVFVGTGSAILKGRAGNDTYYIKAGDVFEEAVNEGRDTVIVSGSYALSSDAQIELLKLSGVSSRVSANLTGSNTANQIFGHAGVNTLKGQGGNDTIHGGAGNDKLYGGSGSGKDTFVFDTTPHKTRNVDRIYDFNPKYDSIWLENKYFTKVGSGSASKPKKFKSDMFVKSSKAQDAEDRIVYDKKSGALYYDKDGTGSASQVKIATLSKNLKLTYSDFFVI
ncbi:hypothetical protein [Microvirga sp. VF16]|uniref:calcium-binding protein n=1 Tax=Microvirga sp. VF16 TaxID=2807101 RepID=UPI00193D2673|nr:hypothetical protein [Microvirga sp. VF16]QRM31249.1 hypothetical protein JO965_09765 [Microvirga sp. VF16]